MVSRVRISLLPASPTFWDIFLTDVREYFLSEWFLYLLVNRLDVLYLDLTLVNATVRVVALLVSYPGLVVGMCKM